MIKAKLLRTAAVLISVMTLLVSLSGCHGSREALNEYEMPQSFDTEV